ncbi:hypothetical protein D3C78_1123980 [compost metagenome]
MARHAQAEAQGGEAALAEVRRDVEQEGGDARVGVEPGQQQLHLLILTDLAAHHQHDLVRQAGNPGGQVFQLAEGDFAAQGAFQHLRGNRIDTFAHAGKAEDLGGEVEAGDFLQALFVGGEGLH